MIEVQDIFKKYGDVYRRNFRGKISPQQHKALWHIEHCRTEYMGGHIDECDECGEILISYNSCGDRHCPKCQFIKKEKWLEARMRDFLPIKYFHVVFTIPDLLHEITLNNQKRIYNILFKSVSETLHVFSNDKKYLGAQTGFITILHTWGQNLMYHPHIHCIVTGGGLSYDKNNWIDVRSEFLYPRKPLAKMFRGKFLDYLTRDYSANNLSFNGSRYNFKKMINSLYKIGWNVYLKHSFKNSEVVFKYLSNYTHRIAISNHRIIKSEDDKVYFKWRDNSDDGKQKIMCLDALEFIRRFLLHVLPHNYFRIRHYGLFANRNRKINIEKCRLALRVTLEEQMELAKKCQDFLDRITDFETTVCPFCKKGKLIFKKELLPVKCNSP